MAKHERAALLVVSADQDEVATAITSYWTSRGARLDGQTFVTLRASPDEPRKWTGRLAFAIAPANQRWISVVDSTAGYADRQLARHLARELGRPVRLVMALEGRRRYEQDFGNRRRFPRAPPPPLRAWEEQPQRGARFLAFSGVQHYDAGYQRSGEPTALRPALQQRDLSVVLAELARARGASLNSAVQTVFSADQLDLSNADDARFLLELHLALGEDLELSSFQTLRVVQAAARALDPVALRAAVKRLGGEGQRYVPMLRQLARSWQARGLEEHSVLLEEAAMALPAS